MFSDIFDFGLLSCIDTSDATVDENIDDDAPIVVEMNKQFSSPGSVVNLSGQDLSDWVSMQSLCARLSRSDNAKSIIYLDHCNLGRHGAAIVSRSFTHVLIRAGNYVAKWLPLMHQNGRILVLSLINNDVGADGAAAVSKMLRINTGLRELNLRYNSLGSDGAQYLASALYVNDGLRFICLSCDDLCGYDSIGNGTYDLTGFAALMRAMHVNTKLRTLKLAENDIGNDGAKHVADALNENSSLRVLDLHGNNMFGLAETLLGKEEDIVSARAAGVDVSVSMIGTPLKSQHQQNEDDDVVETKLLKDIIHDIVDMVVQRESHVPTPSTPCSNSVLLSSSHDQGGSALLHSIGGNDSLTSIDISWNDLGSRGLNVLISSIVSNSNSSLTYLDIHGNPLLDDGACAIANFLRDTSVCKISTLNLQLVGMGPRGAAHLGEALASNESLTKLNISSNRIGATGSEKLSLGLRVNKSVSDLNLRQCGLCAEGIAHIANMLQYNNHLTSLNLSSNAIDDDGATSLAATIAINKSLQTLDLSNYVKTFSPPLSASSSSAVPENSHKVIFNRKIKPKNAYSSIEDSGMEVLALSIRSNQVHLKKLVLKGHWLTPKSEAEMLSAIDERRICQVDAYFPTMKERQQDIINTMKSEHEILTSCFTPSYLRVHLCGQESDAKFKMLDGWSYGQAMEQNEQSQNSASLYSSIFSQANASYFPGVSKRSIILHEKKNILKNTVDPALEVGVWSYEGGYDFHNIFRLHMRGSALGLGLVCASMVGNDNQCRSAEDIAKELYSWLSLLLTYGHNARDIAVIFTNGERFDKAWRGLNPALVQKMLGTAATMDPSTSMSIDKSTSRDDVLNVSTRSHESMHSIDLTDSSASSKPGDKSKANETNVTKDKSADNSDINGPNNENDQKDKRKSIESLLDQSCHSYTDPTDEGNTDPSDNGGVSKQNSDIRCKFEETIRENLSVLLGFKLVPQKFIWDEGRNKSKLPSKVDHWLRDRYKSLSKHVRVPMICKILREKCLPVLRAGSSKVIDINDLLKEGQKHVRCLQNLELRHACQWLHQLGDIVVVDVTAERLSMFHAVENKLIPGNDDTKHENKFFKIILDPSWFSANVLVPIVGRSSSLPLEIQCTQPWGSKEYLLSSHHIKELTAPLQSQLGMSHAELLLVLEHFRIGTVLDCHHIPNKSSEKVLFVPSRINENGKVEWLKSRQIAHIPLSQSSSEPPAVSVVVARRVCPKKPFVIPPCFFACIQAEVLYAVEQANLSTSDSTDKYRVICWDKGLGLWRDDGTESPGKPSGSVCALVECTPKWIHNNWAQDPECAVDVIIWGEGRCSADVVRRTLSFIMKIVHKAGDIVLNGTLRSSDDQSGEEKLFIENPYTPALPPIDWLKNCYLRPGCVLHTLSLTPSDRDCGELADDCNAHEPSSAPVLVSCHHPQPRLIKDHLINGYVIADSPGGGKGLLRSISGSLSNLTIQNEKHNSGTHFFGHPLIGFQFDSTMASE